MNKIKFPSLNGLRAISILLVIIYHLELSNQELSKIMTNSGVSGWLLHFITDGHLGVNIFFVISGFLITSLMLAEEKATNTISLKNFYIRRTLRIFPAYYFLLFVYFILQLAGIIYISNYSWITAITYTKYFNWNLDAFTAHAWSLSIEEHFYLCWPVVFLLGDKKRTAVGLFFMLVVPVIRLYLYYFPVTWINELTIFTRIDSIATGCLIAIYKDQLIALLNPYFKMFFLFSLIGLFILSNLVDFARSSNLHLGFIIVPLGASHGTIANIFIGVILLYSVFGSRGRWFNLLNSKILNYIGMLSYSLYLWQALFINGELKCWVTSFPQNIVFIFALAMFSFYCIEKPFLKLKEKFQNVE